MAFCCFRRFCFRSVVEIFDTMKNKTIKELAKELEKNPKIQKAMKTLLAPLKSKGDSLTISSGDDEIKIDFEDIKK